DDALVAHARAQIEAHALLRVARRSGDDVGSCGEPPDIARTTEVLDDERTVGRFAHELFSEFALPACGASERSRVTSRFTAAIAVSICSAVVKRPRLKRSELCASWSLCPRARSTYEASSDADEHADPADTAISRNANCRLSPSMPWKLTFSST